MAQRDQTHPHHHFINHQRHTSPDGLHNLSLRPTATIRAGSQFLLQPRMFHHSSVVKVDSAAGATGTSVAQLPGRHILVAPWLPLVTGGVLLVFVMLTVAGFVLSFQARKEFRMRLEEQRKVQADLEHQMQTIPQITNKELKSFTRQSIMVLNAPCGPNKNLAPFDVSMTGEVMPRNLFNRPVRDSIIVAEVGPSARDYQNDSSNDDPFYNFSQQITQGRIWDRFSRNSKALSYARFSMVMPPPPSRPGQDPLAMMEMLTEEKNSDQNFQSGNYQAPAMPRPAYIIEPVSETQLEWSTCYKPPANDTSGPRANRTPNQHAEGHQPQYNIIASSLSKPITFQRTNLAQDTAQPAMFDSTFAYILAPSPTIQPTNHIANPPKRKDSRARKQAQSHSPSSDQSTSPATAENISPDDAVAQYASTRAATPSPFSTSSSSAGKTSSVLGFIRRSSRRTTSDWCDRSSPTPSPSPLLISDPMTGKNDKRKTLESADHLRKPESLDRLTTQQGDHHGHEYSMRSLPTTPSVILEENEDARLILTPTYGPLSSSVPGRLPGARRPRLRIDASGSVGTPVKSSNSNLKSSHPGSGLPSTSNPGQRNPIDQPSNPGPNLTLKRLPSLSTNPHATRLRQSPLNDSPEDALRRRPSGAVRAPGLKRISTIATAPYTRNKTAGIKANQQLGMRRAASATARIPLGGTMPSGGVRDSSFVP